MNGWDLFTWFNSVVLVVIVVLIFGFFLRDAGDILKRAGRDDE